MQQHEYKNQRDFNLVELGLILCESNKLRPGTIREKTSKKKKRTKIVYYITGSEEEKSTYNEGQQWQQYLGKVHPRILCTPQDSYKTILKVPRRFIFYCLQYFQTSSNTFEDTEAMTIHNKKSSMRKYTFSSFLS